MQAESRAWFKLEMKAILNSNSSLHYVVILLRYILIFKY